MRYIFLIMICMSTLLATQTEIVHSSISVYGESKEFKNSVQKYDGKIYGVGADVHYGASAYKVAYEMGDTKTKQPPLKENLDTQKIFARYAYNFSQTFAINVNYINILQDNIAITDGGESFGLGVSYKASKKMALNFTQFYTLYEDFNVAQSDFKLNYKSKVNGIGFKVTSITKYILIDEKNINIFTKNAQNSYLTTGLKLHAHSGTWHAGVGAYYGKRAFAIMNDGFKIQHHAMEFDRTYAAGIGKDIDALVLRFQYIYQRAEELPIKNEGVEISNMRFILNYKF